MASLVCSMKMKVMENQTSPVNSKPISITVGEIKESGSVHEETEDACTQTDAGANKTVGTLQIVCSGFGALKKDHVKRITDVSKFPIRIPVSPSVRKRPNQYHKNKTPNTVKMLMEKHRENERMRHHSLNKHLRQICGQVPGSADAGKETKVVMMQRIISYIAYLENTAKFMCGRLNLTSDPTMLKLTSSIQDIEQGGALMKESLNLSSDESKDSDYFVNGLSGQPKLSSPTIDSTTDPSTIRSVFNLSPDDWAHIDNSQDSMVPSSSMYMDYMEEDLSSCCPSLFDTSQDCTIMDTENFDSILSTCDHDMPELPSSTFEANLMKPIEDIQWLGSPEASPQCYKGKTGIQCDLNVAEERIGYFDNTTTISPDQVLTAAAMKAEIIDDELFDSYNSQQQMTPEIICDLEKAQGGNNGNVPYFLVKAETDHTTLPRTNKRKQLSPRRAPLLNITNWSDLHVELPCGLSGEDWCSISTTGPSGIVANVVEVESSATEATGEAVKVTGQFTVSKQELEDTCNTILQEAKMVKFTKVDLRKSSWMNGFMMFSRIHRKAFIKAHPGMPTSNISKLLGQAWREMSQQEQEPFKDQARICAQGLQSMLDKVTFR